jgi:hypothetical protein
MTHIFELPHWADTSLGNTTLSPLPEISTSSKVSLLLKNNPWLRQNCVKFLGADDTLFDSAYESDINDSKDARNSSSFPSLNGIFFTVNVGAAGRTGMLGVVTLGGARVHPGDGDGDGVEELPLPVGAGWGLEGCEGGTYVAVLAGALKFLYMHQSGCPMFPTFT